jgi:hypothetical protein
MYAVFCSKDVWGGGPLDVRSANSTRDVRGTTGRMLLFGITFG